MRVAIIGAGVYGCVAAVDLAAADHQVELHERHPDILYGATRANQGRLHRGYHYPRSQATALNAHADADRFEARFGETLDRSSRHYYAVAADGSLTDAAGYIRHAELLGGEAVDPPPWLHNVAACVRADEAFIDIRRLRARLARDLRAAGVTVRTGSPVVDPHRLPHDLVVMATYGQPWPWDRLRYEVCEVALVELGQHLAGRSVVVMDGPFASVDPVPGTRLHMLYDVRHSVHHAAVGRPEVPDHLAPLVDRGLVPTGHTRVEAMADTARRYVTGMGMTRYVGSMFGTRAVLADDERAARPVLLRRDGRALWLLPGKLDGAVAAAGRIVAAAAVRAGEAVPA